MPSILRPIPLWTGKQIFSLLLKPNRFFKTIINLETKCRTFGKDEKNCKTGVAFGEAKTFAGTKLDESFCPNDGWMIIHNSDVICGVVDKAVIGDGNKKSMFYVVMREYGPMEAASCMNRVAKLASRWLANHGFSIGIDDVQPGIRLREEKGKTVSKGYADCEEAILKSRAGELQNQAGMDVEATLEVYLNVTVVYFVRNIKQN